MSQPTLRDKRDAPTSLSDSYKAVSKISSPTRSDRPKRSFLRADHCLDKFQNNVANECTLQRTKNGEIRVVPMTPGVHQVFVELWQERRLDRHRVFLYKGKTIRRIGTGFKVACLPLLR
jgi:hypothetical protein